MEWDQGVLVPVGRAAVETHHCEDGKVELVGDGQDARRVLLRAAEPADVDGGEADHHCSAKGTREGAEKERQGRRVEGRLASCLVDGVC